MARRRRGSRICSGCAWRCADVCHHPARSLPARDLYDGRPVRAYPPADAEGECPLHEPLDGHPVRPWVLLYLRERYGEGYARKVLMRGSSAGEQPAVNR